MRLGTRKSVLAQAQARWVAGQLRAAGLTIEIVSMATTGDTTPQLPNPNLKALFTKELEEALLDKRIDLAVHSLKDMAGEIPQGLTLAAVPLREDPRDVWIGNRGIHFKDLKKGARVATGAVRRQAQLRHLRSDLEILPMRGNVDTRLRKLEDEALDGMILALAGLKRLGRGDAATDVLSPDVMLPAIGQGALAIETRAGDTVTRQALQSIDDAASHQAALAERAFLKTLGGNCQTPIAAYAQIAGRKLTLAGLVVAPAGDPYLRDVDEDTVQNAEAAGERLARKLLSRGADKLL